MGDEGPSPVLTNMLRASFTHPRFIPMPTYNTPLLIKILRHAVSVITLKSLRPTSPYSLNQPLLPKPLLPKPLLPKPLFSKPLLPKPLPYSVSPSKEPSELPPK